MTSFQIISRFFARNKLLVTATLFASLISNFLNVLLPLSVGKFYEISLHEHSTKSRIMDWLPYEMKITEDFFFFFCALILLKVVVTYFERFWIGLAGERFSRDIREMTFSHQLAQSLSIHRIRPHGKYLLRYSGDLIAIQNFVSQGILVFAGDVFFLCCGFSMLVMINKTLTAITATVFFISGGIIFLLSKQLRIATLNRRNQRSVNLGFVSSRMNVFNTIKSFNREKPEENKFIGKSRKLYELGVKYFRLSALIQSLMPAFFFSALALVMYEVMQMRGQKPFSITKAAVFVFVLLFLYMQGVMRRLLRVNIVWQAGKISLNKLINIINLPVEERKKAKAIERAVNGDLKFQNVSFTYEDGNAVLKNFSFSVRPNSITVIKGIKGSGKSSLFKLIRKLYEPQQGKILIDGLDYAELSPFEVRKNVAVVSEETPLIGNSVFKAISYSQAVEKRGKTARMLEKLKIKFAEAEDANLDFKLEDHARNVSDGERMMLQFARAFLTRKKIILLDEPFHHLDEEAKEIIIEQLNKLRAKRTILLISQMVPKNLTIDQTIEL